MSGGPVLTILCFCFLTACAVRQEVDETPVDGTVKTGSRTLTIDSASLQIRNGNIHLRMDVHNHGRETVAINSFWWRVGSFLTRDIVYGVDGSCIGNLMSFADDTTAGCMSTRIVLPPKHTRLQFDRVKPGETKRLQVDLPLPNESGDVIHKPRYVHISMPYWYETGWNDMPTSRRAWAGRIHNDGPSEFDVYLPDNNVIDHDCLVRLIDSVQGRVSTWIRR